MPLAIYGSRAFEFVSSRTQPRNLTLSYDSSFRDRQIHREKVRSPAQKSGLPIKKLWCLLGGGGDGDGDGGADFSCFDGYTLMDRYFTTGGMATAPASFSGVVWRKSFVKKKNKA